MNQRGFATLEVILMVMVIGILASIAVPRFTSVTTAANTAKIQSDLATIDTAISIYYMENGKYPTTFPNDLSNYLREADNLKPPKGKVFIKGASDREEKTIENDATYSFTTVSGETRAALTVDGVAKTSGDFMTQKKSST